uniref:hypothetical protein n=1 Tax=Cupriavidus taiwanensis TaxID=164546 RepID=UPI0011C07127|nr:hypothetical protein [Cupriavidus taiwanensis]
MNGEIGAAAMTTGGAAASRKFNRGAAGIRATGSLHLRHGIGAHWLSLYSVFLNESSGNMPALPGCGLL